MAVTDVRARLGRAICLIALLWFGLLAGVSFLATPVKFLAPSLTLPVALDVGRQTFAVLNQVELLLALALLAPATMLSLSRAGRRPPLGLGLLAALLVLSQTLWLLPVLDARVEIILQGGTPPASRLHLLYILVDAVKLCLLAATAWVSVREA